MTIDRRHALLIASGVTLAVIAGVTGVGIATRRRTAAVNTLDSPGGFAIKGYDPVAYFIDGRPTPGSREHALTHGGAVWLFANAANKARFAGDPQKYTPAYGGYCAYGVSQGYLVKIEPDAWSIRDGRLYLNYDIGIRTQWEQNVASHIAAADKNWPSLVRSN